jgi:hypothetical protein
VTSDDDAPTPPDEVAGLERQLERGNLFVHSAVGEGFARLWETRAFLFGLVDLLLEKGLITDAEVQAAVENARQELLERGELSGPGTAVRVDPEEVAGAAPVAVDCRARMQVCRAVCCRLDFALSIQEVESGRAKWDLGRPYFIRHESTGYCASFVRESSGCGIYEDRPFVCRQYSCAGDARIWSDFGNMVLNQEWIDANLAGTSRPQGSLMHARDLVQIRRKAPP